MARCVRKKVRDLGDDGFEAENVAACREDVRGGGGRSLGNVLADFMGRGAVTGAETVWESGNGGGIRGGLSRSGLVRALDLKDARRSSGGRGDIGTFHRLASSGKSSSE